MKENVGYTSLRIAEVEGRIDVDRDKLREREIEREREEEEVEKKSNSAQRAERKEEHGAGSYFCSCQ